MVSRKELLKLILDKREECLLLSKKDINVFLFNYKNKNLLFYNRYDHDIYNRSHLEYRLLQIVRAAKSHKQSIDHFINYLRTEFDNSWLVEYQTRKNTLEDILLVTDFVNLGVKLYINDSLREKLSNTNMPQMLINCFNDLVDYINIFDNKYIEKYLIVIKSDQLKNVSKQMESNAIGFERINDRTVLIENMLDFNFFNLIVDRKDILFHGSIKELKDTFFKDILAGFDEKYREELIELYGKLNVSI